MEFPYPAAQLIGAQRILVLGSSGSGKTTLSIQLGRLLRLPVLHLDAQFWKPGWIATPQSEWRDKVAQMIQLESWVMDGTYESSLDLRIPAADAIVLVESSRWACLWRILKRKVTWDDHRRPDAPSGQKLDRAFVRYVWRYPHVTHPFVRECIQRYGAEKTLIQLQGLRGIRHFLQQLQSKVGSNP